MPLAGTLGESYLRSRGLKDPQSDDLKFHPDLSDFETKRGYYGIVAQVRNGAGEPMGIHRTFLTDDGQGKAAPGRKMLGSIAGGSVRLWPMLEDCHLGIAEGIETALAVCRSFQA